MRILGIDQLGTLLLKQESEPPVATSMSLTQMYDNDLFIVVLHQYTHNKSIAESFELVNKGKALSVFLTGAEANAFQARIDFWKEKTPTEDDVDREIDSFMQLGTMPLIFH